LEAYGDRFIPALFGCEIVYHKNQAPSAVHLANDDFDAMAAMTVPNFDVSPVIQKGFADAKMLQAKYGFCASNINCGSPLNSAVSIFGENYLAALLLEPEIAQHVYKTLVETYFKLYREFTHVIQPDLLPLPQLYADFGNCPAIMVSPGLYEKVILPMDVWYRNHCERINIHHCGIIDPYINLYTQLRPTLIDVGGRSDYEALRRAFPDTPFSLIINTCDAESRNAEELYQFLGDMVDRSKPYDKISHLWVNEISDNTAEESIMALATAHQVI